MSGHSGRSVTGQTVSIGNLQFAVSAAQRRLILRAAQAKGSLFVRGAEVRTARALSLFGDLTDDGPLRGDHERWLFTLKDGVRA